MSHSSQREAEAQAAADSAAAAAWLVVRPAEQARMIKTE